MFFQKLTLNKEHIGFVVRPKGCNDSCTWLCPCTSWMLCMEHHSHLSRVGASAWETRGPVAWLRPGRRSVLEKGLLCTLAEGLRSARLCSHSFACHMLYVEQSLGIMFKMESEC